MKHEIHSGMLLIASMRISDPNFARTVVLLCEYGEDGAYGLVLNRPIDVPEEVEDELGFAEGRLFVGGPVQQQALQVLHGFGQEMPEAREIVPGVWIGGDFEALREKLRLGILDRSRCSFLLGYAGWAAGQLESEFELDSWLTAPASAEFVFDTPPEQMWQKAIRERGRVERIFAFFPDDPQWN